MLRSIGVFGFFGIAAVIVGFGVIAYEAPIVAAGLGLVLIGMVLVVHAMLKVLAARFGMAEML